MRKTPTIPSRNPDTCHGGVLIIAIVFAAISAITVGSFIKLAHHELRLSNVQFYHNEALNLAEAGLEEALHALNRETWTDWNTDGSTARFSVRDIPIGRAARGEFHVLVEDRFSLDPSVTAEGSVISGSGLAAAKQVHMTLRKRSYFANTITAFLIQFDGNNAEVESYLSSQGMCGVAPRRDNGSVASISITDSSLDLWNAHIWGYALTGGGELRIGPHGTVRGEDSPAGNVDKNRIAKDFTADLPVALNPLNLYDADGVFDNITETMTLPLEQHQGITDRPIVYIVNDRVNLQNRTLRIDGDDTDVIVIVHGNFSASGSGTFEVAEDSRVRLYAYGDVTISGQGGLVNETHIPSNLVLFGMAEAPNEQQFDLGGNAKWEAGVYAPNANIKLNGGGSDGKMSGGVVGKTVTLNGGSLFCGDEELAGFTDGFGFALDEWTELPRDEWLSFN